MPHEVARGYVVSRRAGAYEGIGITRKWDEDKKMLVDEYTALSAHYGFDALFCNPAEGHEKGLVSTTAWILLSCRPGWFRYTG